MYDADDDVKISQCRLVRVRFVFGKRWGGVPLRGVPLRRRLETGALNGALTGALSGARVCFAT